MLFAIGLTTACKSGTPHLTVIDFANIQEYTEAEGTAYKVDSINGYSTFSADNRIVIIPEEITRKEYERLLTDKYTIQPVAIDTNASLYAELYKKGLESTMRYNRVRGFWWEEEDELLEEEQDYYIIPIYHYPETKQYEYVMLAPLTNESFMMTEDGIIDSTYMQSETRTYGTNRIFVGQEGHDCDFHGSLWFYYYDSSAHHMVPLCHYKDYRWCEEAEFNLCWISENELIVSAASTGNSVWGWAGGYKPTNLAPYGTPVYYKLTFTVR